MDAENAQSMVLCCTVLCQREDIAMQVLSSRRPAGAWHSILTQRWAVMKCTHPPLHGSTAVVPLMATEAACKQHILQA